MVPLSPLPSFPSLRSTLKSRGSHCHEGQLMVSRSQKSQKRNGSSPREETFQGFRFFYNQVSTIGNINNQNKYQHLRASIFSFPYSSAFPSAFTTPPLAVRPVPEIFSRSESQQNTLHVIEIHSSDVEAGLNQLLER